MHLKINSSRREEMNVGVAPMKSAYEPGMKISYDPVSMRVVVAFRGRITVLPQTCITEAEAIALGESHCRHFGWKAADHEKKSRKFRSLW